LQTGQPDERMQMGVLKTIAAFLNVAGGTLLIGVNDAGDAVGLKADAFPNDDKMSLHLVNLIRDRIGELFLPYVHPEFVEYDGQTILSVRCERGPKPAFVKDGSSQKFFVRAANATAELSGTALIEYSTQRFN
jgi:predicted HTH transcriptional regulator